MGQGRRGQSGQRALANTNCTLVQWEMPGKRVGCNRGKNNVSFMYLAPPPGSSDPAPGLFLFPLCRNVYSSRASIVISAFNSLDTGHPDLALFATSPTLALLAPGLFAATFRWLRGFLN